MRTSLKTLFTTVVSITSLFTAKATAQFVPGGFYAGGSVGGYTQFVNSDEQGRSIGVSPILGYGLTDKTSVGLNPSFAWYKQTDMHSLQLDVFLRHIVAQTGPFGVSITVSPFYSYATSDFGMTEEKSWGGGVGIYPTLSWFPTGNISLDLGLGRLEYSYFRQYQNDDLTERVHTLNANLDSRLLSLSVLYHFGK